MFRPEKGLDSLVPRHMRAVVAAGAGAPLYVVKAPDYDRLPLETFLVDAAAGTAGRLLTQAMRIVRPNHPERYSSTTLTKEGRLLYCFWYSGNAVRVLAEPRMKDYRHIVLPDDPRAEMVEAFKIACDTRRSFSGRAVRTDPALLYKALGVEPMGVKETAPPG